MRKSTHVRGSTGNDYLVTFSDKSGTLKATCTCQAGEFGTLCKHVLEVIQTDKEIRNELQNYGYISIYEEYLSKLAEAERIKKEAATLKKKFQQLLLR